MQTIALVASGDLKSPHLIAPRIKTFQRIVAVDGGLIHCHEMGICPHFLIGDFDSCPPKLLAQYPQVPRLTLPADKNMTDLEAALEHELDQPAIATLFAGWGRRVDHSLTNALILTRYPGKLRLETEDEILFALEKRASLKCRIGQILSLMPLNGPVKGITTTGLKWELNNGELDSHFIGISNVCLQTEIKIQFKTGSLLCCLEK